MALITIEGVEIPSPSEYNVGVQDISKAERNAQGTMIIERIATKKTIELRFSFLNASDLSTVLQSVAPTFFNVKYLDPVTNSYKTSSFYCGDKSIGMMSFTDGVPKYKDIKFTLIER